VNRVRLISLSLCAVSLSGCLAPAVVAEISGAVAGAKATYDVIGLITSADASAIISACQEWRVTSAASTARIQDGVVPADKAKTAKDTSPWLDATCDPSAPPPKDPIAAAVWLATLSGRIDQLSQP
jgi:hypothetical protein